ncbi:MAG: hypothetical protein Q8L22_06260 [Reyranella sp.]|nr:hypothetical protein [Reyranella sp.]
MTIHTLLKLKTEPASTSADLPPARSFKRGRNARKRRRYARWMVMAGAIVSGLLGFAYWTHATSRSSVPATAARVGEQRLELAPIGVYRVRRAGLQKAIHITGATKAANLVLVKSQVTARVVDLCVAGLCLRSSPPNEHRISEC